MTKAMQALIKQADTDRGFTNGRPSWSSGATAEFAVGTVNCYRDYTVAGSIKKPHARTTWKLCGKVISAAKLAELI